MADQGDAKIFKVVGGQVGQEIGADGIIAECRLVLFETERSQPVRDIHRRSLLQSDRCKRVCSVSRDLSSGNLHIGD